MERVARSILFDRIGGRVACHYISAKCNELLCVTIDGLLSEVCGSNNSGLSMNKRISIIKNILEKDMQSKLSVSVIAQEYNISPRRVNKEFEERYGVSIQDYRTMVRLSRSVHLLLSTTMPLKMIAHEVGYDHASNFCMAFKKHYGYTPKEIRRTQPQNGD